MEIKVLYEDNHLIAVYKPAGVLVQKGKTEFHDDNTVYWQVKEFIKKRDNKPGEVFLGILHRLDRPVSGIVLLAKTSKGAGRLSEQFRERTIKKIYHAVVIGKPEQESATLQHTLWKDHDKKKSMVGTEGEEAILHYEIVKSNEKYSLLKIWLETGRFHQIRAQLSAIGHPIVGDVKYGATEELPNHFIMLCATELYFKTATGDEDVEVTIEIPHELTQKVA
ncbi:MAG: RNA pseudouridine synthase [Patescibacteria group bacterium]